MAGGQESSHIWQSHKQRRVEGAGAMGGDGGGEGEESRQGITPSPSSVSHLVHFASASMYSVRMAMTAHSLFQVKYEVLHVRHSIFTAALWNKYYYHRRDH